MKITVAQVKIVPEKKKMSFNHDRLMKVLAQIAPHQPTVTVTGECFLDGYVVTEEGLNRKRLMDYAIDPLESDSSAFSSAPTAAATAPWATLRIAGRKSMSDNF